MNMKILFSILGPLMAFQVITAVYDRLGQLVFEFTSLLQNGQDIQTALINFPIDKHVDNILMEMTYKMVKEGLDPMPLNDFRHGFSVRPFLIEYTANIQCSNGVLRNLAKLKRNGTSTLTFDAAATEAIIGISLSLIDVRFSYDYAAKVMQFGPTGKIVGNVDDIEFELSIGADLGGLLITLHELQVTQLGVLSFEFTESYGLINSVANFLSPVIQSVVHEVVLNAVQDAYYEQAKKIVYEINKRLRPFM